MQCCLSNMSLVASSSMFEPRLAPRKCWICDLQKLQSPCTVEIVGTIVRLNETQMTVDDGTGSVQVQLEGHEIKGQIGDNVDCVLQYEHGGKAVTDTIVWKVPPGAETLFQWQILAPPGEFGYPKLAFSKHDLLRCIKSAGSGVILEDLSLVLDRPVQEILSMIHELQNDGAIYQNREGEYVLL